MKAIDGEELLNRIYDCGFPDIDQYGRIEKSKVAEIIHKLPELTTNEKGEWIKENKLFCGFGDGILVNTCSQCRESFIYHGFDANFCPECGADMREVDND